MKYARLSLRDCRIRGCVEEWWCAKRFPGLSRDGVCSAIRVKDNASLASINAVQVEILVNYYRLNTVYSLSW